ncbi:MAG: LCP family protein [Clostridia bacterium]|nr:LCP family protein [Clostridia bacterium]
MKYGFALALCLLLMLAALPALGEGETQPDPVWENILLIGEDTRRDVMEEGRADAIMVASVNRENGAVRLISLARDMWIRIPGSSAYNKINAAYRFGGPEMMLQAVTQTLGLEIEKYAAVNFFGFCDVIDALGGIEVDMSADEAAHINRTARQEYSAQRFSRLSEGDGVKTLSGEQALAFARIRKLDNDFGRGQRQRRVILAVLEKVRSLGFGGQLGFVKSCLDCMSTNMGLGDIMTLGMAIVRGGMEDVRQLGLPSAGNYHYDSEDGVSKVIFNAEETRREAQAFIYGDAADMQ